MVNGDCFAIKEGSERIRREGDDGNVIFRLQRLQMFQSSRSTVSIPNVGEARRVCKVMVT